METYRKQAFCVIGREGSTRMGAGFIDRLWQDFDAHCGELAPLALRNEQGNYVGFWGAMSDFSRSFQPWTDGFRNGLYLAGAECAANAEAPDGWTKWTIPAYEYLCVEADTLDVFPRVIRQLEEERIPLAGAVHDFIRPSDKKRFMYFPIKRL